MKRIPIDQIIIPKITTSPVLESKLSSFVGVIPGWLLTRLSDRLSSPKGHLSLLTKLLLILVLVLVLMGWWAAPVALAKTQFLKEADQWVYQAHHTLVDTDAQTWDVTVIKPMEGGRKGVFLHVETKSPMVQLDASAPLGLTTESGQTLMADNVTQQYFIGSIPDPAVGEYDIQILLPDLRGEQQLQLQFPTQEEEAIIINIAPDVLAEWLTVGTCEYLVCDTP